MKTSLNWLKTYIDLDKSPEEVGDLLTGLGLEVEGLETVQSVPGGLKGVFVGEVIECGKHPNADRLSLTRVDVGEKELLQIVCGAPNVAKGQKVLVARVGTTLYPTDGDPIQLKKGKIRGEVSEGMICAEDELGLGTNHDGILVLPENSPVGKPAADYFQLETDHVYEIGLTPNRSDATAHLGVARDLAAFLRINEKYNRPLQLPDVSRFKVDHTDLQVEVVVENTEACPRYSGISIQGITVKESPDWLKKRLLAIGVRPLNNIVDITNFILHELGQPLHAFDLAQVAGRKVIVKTLPEGTPFTTLDERQRNLLAEDLMICNGQSEGMCIAGVFGGISSGVTEKTKDIFLESAHFQAQWVRRTSMKHNLRTDAAKIYEKGSDPEITVYALKRAALLIQELAGGKIASEIVDVYPQPVERAVVEVKLRNVKRLTGIDLQAKQLKEIFAALDMEVLKEEKGTFTVTVPTNKSDVTREADVIEEILRIYGYNKVPEKSRMESALAIAPYPDPVALRNQVGDMLAANGLLEMMGLSLSESRFYQEIYTDFPEEELIYIKNTSNVQLNIMRPDMLFNGLSAVVHNQNRQQQDLKLFEFGKTYRQKGDTIQEVQHLSLFLTGNRHPESWLIPSARVDFFSLKALVQRVFQRLGIRGYQETPFQDPVFQLGLRFHRGQQELASFGKVNPGFVKAMEIKSPVWFADMHWDNLTASVKPEKLVFEEISRFPQVRRDLALVIDNSVNFQDIVTIAGKGGKKLLKAINLFDVYENEEQLGKGKKSYAVSFIFEDPERTLSDKEIDKVMTKLITQFESKLSAVIRR
jgi:phenylalanyl-tRNA synthetase beta chain